MKKTRDPGDKLRETGGALRKYFAASKDFVPRQGNALLTAEAPSMADHVVAGVYGGFLGLSGE